MALYDYDYDVMGMMIYLKEQQSNIFNSEKSSTF